MNGGHDEQEGRGSKSKNSLEFKMEAVRLTQAVGEHLTQVNAESSPVAALCGVRGIEAGSQRGSHMKSLTILTLIAMVTACSEEWTCRVDGKTMYSISESGKLGSADNGCSCEQMRAFELRTFGEVDEDALRSDFGC